MPRIHAARIKIQKIQFVSACVTALPALHLLRLSDVTIVTENKIILMSA